ncbi:excalibur calcium-binding domain-containing protein [Pseudonocardia nigra]|uniref:excalibur calcium-binding domain-containing protein n=1 Tax=Pseudonocardia nigra TaxID=1921578 RepID=UPI001C5DE694|nr:excalibur calcium-binding domain-containing protein [Pseudonocardia nigra]
MRIRTAASAAVLAAATAVLLAGPAHAQEADRDCPDFASQEAAQAAFNSQVGDPERLDRDDDGEACEEHFTDETAESTDDEESTDGSTGDDEQVAAVPRGGVETGDGSTAPVNPAPVLLLLGGAAALGAAAVRRSR